MSGRLRPLSAFPRSLNPPSFPLPLSPCQGNTAGPQTPADPVPKQRLYCQQVTKQQAHARSSGPDLSEWHQEHEPTPAGPSHSCTPIRPSRDRLKPRPDIQGSGTERSQAVSPRSPYPQSTGPSVCKLAGPAHPATSTHKAQELHTRGRTHRPPREPTFATTKL